MDTTNAINVKDSATYKFSGKTVVVQPVFRENAPESLGSILLKLMRQESEKS